MQNIRVTWLFFNTNSHICLYFVWYRNKHACSQCNHYWLCSIHWKIRRTSFLKKPLSFICHSLILSEFLLVYYIYQFFILMYLGLLYLAIFHSNVLFLISFFVLPDTLDFQCPLLCFFSLLWLYIYLYIYLYLHIYIYINIWFAFLIEHLKDSLCQMLQEARR